MNLLEFQNFIKNEVNWREYGICPPPITAEDAMNILIEYFLGKDWYVTLSLTNEQVYTVAVCKIINKVHMRR